MAKKIFSKKTLAVLLALVMCFSSLQMVASAAGANGKTDARGNWTYAYYLGQEYLGNDSGAAVKPDPVGYGFQGVITSITFTDDAGTSWTFNWSSEANGEWRITGSNVSKDSASAWPQITDGKVYIGYCGNKAYTFTLGHEGSSESWTYADTQRRHANWFRYIRFIREYTVNVFYQNETGSIVYNGETFAAAAPVTGSFHFLYPNGNIIDDSEYEDGEYTEPTTLLPADYLPQSMIDQGYEIKYATDANGNNVLTSGVTISLLGDNVLNVYCTLIPPATEDYAIVHNYYVEGTFEGTQSGGSIEVTEGSNFDTIVDGIEKKTSYNSNTYSYISYTVDPSQKVITLTYSRDLPTYDYSVIYDANFGTNATAPDSENVTGVKDTAKNITADGNTFPRDNYYFAGWNTERDGSGTAYAAGSTVALTAQNNTEVLYAQWQEYPKYDYVVTYNANFGDNDVKADSENAIQVYDTAKTITVDSNPFPRANYTFLGWATDADGEVVYQAYDQISFTEGGSEELFAVWQEYPKYDYSVTYNANFGETPATAADEENVSQVYDTSKSISVNENTFTRANYTFLGWATEADGEVVYQADDQISFTEGGSEELFAVWQEYPKYDYSVTYNANFGETPATAADEENVSQVYDTTKSISVNANPFTRANYTFLGWALEADGEVVYQAGNTISFTEGGSEELFAVWQEHNKYSYALSYNGNGGVLANSEVAYADAENISNTYSTAHSIEVDENTFSRANYTFTGWNTQADGSGISYTAENVIGFTPENNTLVLFAQWQENPKYDYTVIYNANFDDNVLRTDDESVAQVYDTAKVITVDENTFVRENYDFIGWATESDGEVVYQAGTQISFSYGGSEELFAVWQEHPKYDYIVNYNANFGLFPDKAADLENITDTYATAYSITVDENTFSRANHTFIGWSETKNGEVIYSANDVLSFIEGGEKTLYAQWIEHDKYSYSVIYNGNGGKLSDEAISYGDSENLAETYETAHNITVDENTFSREHHSFAGWNTEADGTGIAYTAEEVISLTAQYNTETLYAQWIEHDKYSYSVIYNGNGGKLSDEAISYGDSENLVETYETTHNITVDENTFSRAHHSFAGWNTEADGTGIAYTAEEVIALTAQNNTETLYAQWTLDNVPYTVEYKVQVDDEPYEDFTGELPEGAPTGGEVPYGTEPEIVPPASITDDTYTYDFTKQEVDGDKIIIYYSYETPEPEPTEPEPTEPEPTEPEPTEPEPTEPEPTEPEPTEPEPTEPANVEYTVEYKVQVDDEPYEDFTGELPEGAPENVEVPYGTEPEIVPPASISDETYTYDFIKQEVDGDKIIVYYSFNTPETEPIVEIPEEEVPLAPAPEVKEEPIVEIPEEEVPLAPAPEVEEELVEILDEEVPLANVPKTGDTTILYAALTTLSGLGLAALGLKKKEEDTEA